MTRFVISGRHTHVLIHRRVSKWLVSSRKGHVPTKIRVSCAWKSTFLFCRADRRQWKKEGWREAINDAAKAAKLPEETCAYSLRHSAITDLVTSGLDLFHVAQLSGTSVVMIEKNYGHLQRKHARARLQVLGLK